MSSVFVSGMGWVLLASIFPLIPSVYFLFVMTWNPDKPDNTILRAKKILIAHFLLVVCSVKFGISLTHWQNVVNSMIEKNPGNPRTHRLRVIHLYEVDYSLGSEARTQAEDT
jgi:hypothetical protein